MNILSKLTVKPLLWTSGILLVVAIALAGALVVQSAWNSAEVAGLEAKVASTDAALTLAKHDLAVTGKSLNNALQTNLSMKTSVDDLAQRLQDEVGRRQNTQAALEQAEHQRDAARSSRDTAIHNLKTEREKLYATDATCADWGARPVCAAVSDSLQEQWGRATSPGGDRGQGGGGGQAAAGADQRHPD